MNPNWGPLSWGDHSPLPFKKTETSWTRCSWRRRGDPNWGPLSWGDQQRNSFIRHSIPTWPTLVRKKTIHCQPHGRYAVRRFNRSGSWTGGWRCRGRGIFRRPGVPAMAAAVTTTTDVRKSYFYKVIHYNYNYFPWKVINYHYNYFPWNVINYSYKLLHDVIN